MVQPWFSPTEKDSLFVECRCISCTRRTSQSVNSDSRSRGGAGRGVRGSRPPRPPTRRPTRFAQNAQIRGFFGGVVIRPLLIAIPCMPSSISCCVSFEFVHYVISDNSSSLVTAMHNSCNAWPRQGCNHWTTTLPNVMSILSETMTFLKSVAVTRRRARWVAIWRQFLIQHVRMFMFVVISHVLRIANKAFQTCQKCTILTPNVHKLAGKGVQPPSQTHVTWCGGVSPPNCATHLQPPSPSDY